jgi:hypothetical protein
MKCEFCDWEIKGDGKEQEAEYTLHKLKRHGEKMKIETNENKRITY